METRNQPSKNPEGRPRAGWAVMAPRVQDTPRARGCSPIRKAQISGSRAILQVGLFPAEAGAGNYHKSAQGFLVDLS